MKHISQFTTQCSGILLVAYGKKSEAKNRMAVASKRESEVPIQAKLATKKEHP